MKSTLSRKLALSLAIAMMLGLFAGCAGAPPAGTATDAPAAAATDKPADNAPAATQEQVAADPSKVDMSNVNTLGSIPILKEKAQLTVLIPTNTNVEDMETNDYTKKLEEGVNCDLTFEYLPATDTKQKLSVMISSGSKLPDVVMIGLTPIETYTYGSQGFFLPLNDLIANTHYTKTWLDTEGQDIMKYVYSPDGNIYGYPRICEDLGNDWDHRLWINKTWLDKLSLKVPTTTDEYYEVLKAFKEKDPNGNGKPDELPLVGNTNGWNQSAWRPLMYAFTYLNDTFDYLQLGDDGKLKLSYTQPEYRDGLEWMNKLSNEGLLSPLTFTQDQNQFKQLIEDPDAQLIGSMTAGSMSVYQVESKRKEDITHMAPLIGPKGVQLTNYRNSGIPDPFGFITKDCADPVAATMLFDYMWNRDMALQARFGVKDVDWKTPEAGVESMYAKMGYKPLIEYINPIWGTLQNHQWGESHPTLRTYDMICGVTWGGKPFDSQYMTAQAVPEYMGKAPDESKLVMRIIYTKEEADQIAEIQSSLNTYRDEAAAAFITGTRPLSDWDKYIQEIEAMGSATYLEVTQKAYDRMNQQ